MSKGINNTFRKGWLIIIDQQWRKKVSQKLAQMNCSAISKKQLSKEIL